MQANSPKSLFVIANEVFAVASRKRSEMFALGVPVG